MCSSAIGVDPDRYQGGDDPVAARLGEHFDGNVVVGGKLGQQRLLLRFRVRCEVDSRTNFDRTIRVRGVSEWSGVVMAEAASSAISLAYDDEGGDGVGPRASCSFTASRLTDGGIPAPLEDVAAQLHELITALAVEHPVVVGHSMSGGLACIYAATYSTSGV